MEESSGLDGQLSMEIGKYKSKVSPSNQAQEVWWMLLLQNRVGSRWGMD